MFGSSPSSKASSERMAALVARIRAGELRAISRAISFMESDPEAVSTLAQHFKGETNHGVVVGITGYPGVGKSTVVDRLIDAFRVDGKRVGVLAVDISSPLTGGALLGDRVRMQRHALDEGVYIRSMATRGHAGGLARSTCHAITVLSAAGYDLILVETVGVGQEVGEITTLADVVVVIVAPGLGDEIQAMKAGLFEVAHLVVVNKADHPEAQATIATLRRWIQPVLATVAVKGEGIPELKEAILSLASQSSASPVPSDVSAGGDGATT
ncbi:MAG: methylmalonyl Co-A mutase-associated GTPase MeaB [Nitrospirae bacterium]|nr:MAG: methylmalonyl Co-A mutase-associated GTPase MeaB [Nitrospirota bacterium]